MGVHTGAGRGTWPLARGVLNIPGLRIETPTMRNYLSKLIIRHKVN